VTNFEGDLKIGYRFDRSGRLSELQIDGESLQGARLHACSADRVDLEVAGVRRTYAVADGAVNTPEGQVDLAELPRFRDPGETAHAGSLTSPMPGSVMRVMVKRGDAVEARQPLLVLEAMKMEHEIIAPTAGVVAELRVAEGTQVEMGALLAVIEDGA
jgi:propionyl-CoA carboxylase alpha chain